jgi:glycosyltransferase involved in cell wall biosynthesis
VRVCYFGTYRLNYARNQTMIEGLRRNGIEVIECHETLWQGVEDRIRLASGGWLRPSFWWRFIKTYSRLLRRYRSIPDYDILIVGYPGQYDIFLARLLAWLRRKSLVWDVLNSMYLISLERGLARNHRFTAGLIRLLERLALHLPDRLILDSTPFVDWFCKTHHLDPARFRLVPIGADERAFQQFTPSTTVVPAAPSRPFTILYYGSFIPNHGVDVIVEAANLLRAEPDIRFELTGDGPCKPVVQSLARRYNLENLIFTDWLEKPALLEKLTGCDICLGTFGDTLQASLTNNNKIYEGFAVQKPVISGASPALPTALRHGENLYLCSRGDAQALAAAILALKNDPELCARLGRNGYETFYQHFDTAQIGKAFAVHLRDLTQK